MFVEGRKSESLLIVIVKTRMEGSGLKSLSASENTYSPLKVLTLVALASLRYNRTGAATPFRIFLNFFIFFRKQLNIFF